MSIERRVDKLEWDSVSDDKHASALDGVGIKDGELIKVRDGDELLYLSEDEFYKRYPDGYLIEINRAVSDEHKQASS